MELGEALLFTAKPARMRRLERLLSSMRTEGWRKLFSPQLYLQKLFQLTSDAIRMKLKFRTAKNESAEISPQEMSVTSSTSLPRRVLVTVRFAHQWCTRAAQFVSHCTAWTARLTSLKNTERNEIIGAHESRGGQQLPEELCCHHIPLPMAASARDKACPRFSDCDR